MAVPINNNAINYIQEVCVKRSKAFPIYKEMESTGPPHCKTFFYSCSFDEHETIGSGMDKKSAKKESASKMVKLLQDEGFFDSSNDVNLSSSAVKSVDSNNKPTNETQSLTNPISALLEFCQRKKIEFPTYFETSLGDGKGFICDCLLGHKKTSGQGANKKSAKAESSANMCKELNIPFSKIGLQSTSNSEENSGSEDKKETQCLLNPVTALLQFCQGKQIPSPVFSETSIDDDKTFICECTFGNKKTFGQGTSKKTAKAESSAKMCAELNISFYKQNLESISNGENNVEPKSLAANEAIKNLAENHQQTHKGDINSPGLLEINTSSPAKSRVELKEFDLDDDDSAIDLNSTGNEVESSLHYPDSKTIATLESLSLDDTVVEVEPSAVTKTDSNTEPFFS